MDRRILPILGVLYALALIDRSNLGVARIVGMGKDLVGSLRLFHLRIQTHCSFLGIDGRKSIQHRVLCKFDSPP